MLAKLNEKWTDFKNIPKYKSKFVELVFDCLFDFLQLGIFINKSIKKLFLVLLLFFEYFLMLWCIYVDVFGDCIFTHLSFTREMNEVGVW